MATTAAFPKLIEAADRLSRMAPTDWKTFVEALSAYSTELTTYCLNASPVDLPAAQGRAHIAAHLARELANCQATQNKRTT